MLRRPMTIGAVLVLVVAALLPVLADSQQVGGPEQAVRAYVDAFNSHDIDAFGTTVSTDVVVYGLLGTDGVVHGRDAYAAALASWFVTFPDLNIDIEKLITEGDMVATLARVTGTQSGTFPIGEVPGTGTVIAIDALALFRIEDGVVAEKWYRQDDLSLLVQVGVIDLGSSE